MGSPRILVSGCGAIGGVVAAHLIEQGHDVGVLTTNPKFAKAMRDRGLHVFGENAPDPVRPRRVLVSLEDETETYDYVLLTTQPTQVEDAARAAARVLAPEGRMVCFQNGLCEERVAKIVGAERVIGAVVAWGASVVEAAVVDRTSSGGFSLGRLEGENDGAVDEIGRMLEAVGPVTLSDNLRGARWSKLAINCAISTLGTIGGDRLGPLIVHRHVRRLGLDIMTETVAVAKAEGVRLQKVAGTIDLDWIALSEAEKQAAGSPGLVAKHGLLLAVGARYRRLRSSMLSAIERGRPPAVDFLNGEVVDRGEAHGIPTPVNRAARDRVWAISRGEMSASHETVRGLYESTR